MFLTVIFVLIYCYTPKASKHWVVMPDLSLYQFLKSSWLGKLHLWQAFWPFFLLVNAILYYIDYRVLNVTYTITSWKTAHGMLFLPSVWWVTSVWRCSGHTRHKIWSSAARAITVYLFIDYFLRFIISTYYPETFFDCRLLIMNHGDCL